MVEASSESVRATENTDGIEIFIAVSYLTSFRIV